MCSYDDLNTIFVLLRFTIDVFDYEDDDEIPIGKVYYDWYHMNDK